MTELWKKLLLDLLEKEIVQRKILWERAKFAAEGFSDTEKLFKEIERGGAKSFL